MFHYSALVDFSRNIGLTVFDKMVGCTDPEVNLLLESVSLELPRNYIEFLRFFGSRTEDVRMFGYFDYFYADVLRLTKAYSFQDMAMFPICAAIDGALNGTSDLYLDLGRVNGDDAPIVEWDGSECADSREDFALGIADFCLGRTFAIMSEKSALPIQRFFVPNSRFSENAGLDLESLRRVLSAEFGDSGVPYTDSSALFASGLDEYALLYLDVERVDQRIDFVCTSSRTSARLREILIEGFGAARL